MRGMKTIQIPPNKKVQRRGRSKGVHHNHWNLSFSGSLFIGTDLTRLWPNRMGPGRLFVLHPGGGGQGSCSFSADVGH